MTATAGALIKALKEVDDEIDIINGELREYKRRRDDIVVAIEALMDAQGTTMLAAEGLVCEAKEDEVPRIVNWEDVENYVIRNKALSLFQRRLSPAVWRALIDERDGQPVPGIEPFKTRKLSVRAKGTKQ